MKFGKLEEGKLQLFHPPLRVDGKDIFTNDPELLLEYGWKEVVYTAPPEPREGYALDFRWEETETKITRIWEYVPEETEE